MKQTFNQKIYKSIVKVSCNDTEFGTAFFIAPKKLITAAHVVMPSINNKTVKTYIEVDGVRYECKVARLKVTTQCTDIAILECDGYVQEAGMSLLSSKFSESQHLWMIGYPNTINGGKKLEQIRFCYERTTEELKYNQIANLGETCSIYDYRGFSGGPVLNECGSVVGVAIKQIDSNLGFKDIVSVAKSLGGDVHINKDWQRENLGTYGYGRSFEYSLQKIEDARGRYDSELDIPNSIINRLLSRFCNITYCRNLRIRIPKIINALKSGDVFFKDYPETAEDFIEKFKNEIDPNMEKNRQHEYLKKTLGDRKKNEDIITQILNTYNEYLYYNIQFLIIKGKAGTGKTHSICHFIQKEKYNSNVYLLYGTDFNATDDIRKQICALLRLPSKDGLKELSLHMEELNSGAVIIIDALNEGANDSFWKRGVKILYKYMKDHAPNVRIVISVREPFDKVLFESEDDGWEKYEVMGFLLNKSAVKEYFDYYDVDFDKGDKYKKDFKNPLFLKIFCTTYGLLSDEEKENINRLTLYRNYLRIRNSEVCDIVNEDDHRQLTEEYMRKLCNYSIFYRCGSLVCRAKARQIGDQLCRGRFWNQSLLYAMIKESLLLETKSSENEDQLMLEFENMADFIKADLLLNSKMSSKKIVDFLLECNKRASNDITLNKQKLNNCVSALLGIWNRDDLNLLKEERFVNAFGKCFGQAKDYEGRYKDDIVSIIKTNLLIDNPQEMLSAILNDEKYEFDAWHQQMLKLSQHDLDLQWTTKVDELFDWLRYSFQNTFAGDGLSSENRDNMSLVLAWMLACSHPIATSLIMRKLYSLYKNNEVLNIVKLLDTFGECKDPYILQGIYGVAYGLVLSSRDSSFCDAVADYTYHNFSTNGSALKDLWVRQWVLKIFERAFHLNPESKYWKNIKLPFEDIWELIDLKNTEKIPENYFGTSVGSTKIYNSLTGFSDFKRYIIGTNNRSSSNEHYTFDNNGNGDGLNLMTVISLVGQRIMSLGWSDDLGAFDTSRYSSGRFNNETERIGKKYQWMALRSVEAQLMDCMPFVSSKQYKSHIRKEDVTIPYPWYSRHRSYFDITLPNKEDVETILLPIFQTFEDEELDSALSSDWLANDEIKPVPKWIFTDESGEDWVSLWRFDNQERECEDTIKELALFYIPVLVHNADEDAFTRWAADQMYYGRWMPEIRNGDNEALWNEYPWSDTYKSQHWNKWEQNTVGCPFEMRLPYMCLLQENKMGLSEEDAETLIAEVYAPCDDMMNYLNLYTAERGIVRSMETDEIISIDTRILGLQSGIIIRRSFLNRYLRHEDVSMFYTHIGEKTIRQREHFSEFGIRRYTGAGKYNKEGDITVLQPITDEEEFIKAHPKTK